MVTVKGKEITESIKDILVLKDLDGGCVVIGLTDTSQVFICKVDLQYAITDSFLKALQDNFRKFLFDNSTNEVFTQYLNVQLGVLAESIARTYNLPTKER